MKNRLMRKAIRKTKTTPRRKIAQIRRSMIAGMSGAEGLEQEAKRLKEKYPSIFHPTIDKNLEWVSRGIDAVPGSVSVQEGMLALSNDLPPIPPIPRKNPARKRGVSGK